MLSGVLLVAMLLAFLHLALSKKVAEPVGRALWKSFTKQNIKKLFMIGDSTIIKQVDSLFGQERWLRKYVTAFKNAGGRCDFCDLPSFQERRACPFVRSQNSSKKEAIAYLNFGALHLLHIHPYRPWSYSENKFDGMHVADFNGFFFLEDWMISELNCLSDMVDLILVQTPHYVCDEVFTGVYMQAIRDPEAFKQGLRGCADLITGRSGISHDAAYRLCESGQLTGRGSGNLAARMRNTIRSHFTCMDSPDRGAETPVCIVDAYNITASINCSEHTHDGRHYDRMVILQELQLVADFVEARCKSFGEQASSP